MRLNFGPVSFPDLRSEMETFPILELLYNRFIGLFHFFPIYSLPYGISHDYLTRTAIVEFAYVRTTHFFPGHSHFGDDSPIHTNDITYT